MVDITWPAGSAFASAGQIKGARLKSTPQRQKINPLQLNDVNRNSLLLLTILGADFTRESGG